MEKTVSPVVRRKCSPLQERGAAADSRLYDKGAALCIDLETGLYYENYYYSSMPVRTRGGSLRNFNWQSTRVFTTALGVKIRRVNGRYQYNPPSLKFSCVRVLDHHFPDPSTPRLYATVQGFLDQLIDKVEDRLKGLQGGGGGGGGGEGIVEHPLPRIFTIVRVHKNNKG